MTASLRYRNASSVVIRVDETTATTLGREWEPISAKEPKEIVPPGDSGEPEIPAGNASRESWAAYATHLGIDVGADAKRDEIRALVENLLGDED